VKNFFRDGWDFGIFTLVIGLPILAALIYLFGVSVWDVLTNPTKYWLVWFYLAIWLSPSLVKAVRQLFKQQPDIEGEGANG
jgi:hypothetical protein